MELASDPQPLVGDPLASRSSCSRAVSRRPLPPRRRKLAARAQRVAQHHRHEDQAEARRVPDRGPARRRSARSSPRPAMAVNAPTTTDRTRSPCSATVNSITTTSRVAAQLASKDENAATAPASTASSAAKAPALAKPVARRRGCEGHKRRAQTLAFSSRARRRAALPRRPQRTRYPSAATTNTHRGDPSHRPARIIGRDVTALPRQSSTPGPSCTGGVVGGRSVCDAQRSRQAAWASTSSSVP